MKRNWGVVVWVAAVISILGLAARADDYPLTQLGMSADAGADTICTAQLSAKVHYVVQPTVDTYVAVSPLGDGGVSVDGGQLVTDANPLIGANKVYDTWTTTDRRYICCKPFVAGAASKCKVFKFILGDMP